MGKLTKNQKLAAEKIEAGKAYSLKEAIQFGCKARCRSRIGRSKIDARTHNNTY